MQPYETITSQCGDERVSDRLAFVTSTMLLARAVNTEALWERQWYGSVRLHGFGSDPNLVTDYIDIFATSSNSCGIFASSM